MNYPVYSLSSDIDNALVDSAHWSDMRSGYTTSLRGLVSMILCAEWSRTDLIAFVAT